MNELTKREISAKKQAAERVETDRKMSTLETFEQSRTSARQNSKWQTRGWTGSATFRDVPLALIPWLVWAGRLGIGDSRNCGAGLFHIVLA